MPDDNDKEDSAYGLLTRFCESRGWKLEFKSGPVGEVEALSIVVYESESQICNLRVITREHTATSASESIWSVWAKYPVETEDICEEYLSRLLGHSVQWYEDGKFHTEKFPASAEELGLNLAARGF